MSLKDEYEEMIEAIIEYHATKAQRDMKLDAPWTDRTSAARNGLFTVVEHEGDRYTIILSHSVEYGIWLEVKFSGRDAIVAPTILSSGKALMRDLKDMMR